MIVNQNRLSKFSARAYEYRHIVAFEETNLVGNVYYVNHVRWQGRCREMFLREHAPTVLERLDDDLVLATTHCSCDYYDELRAFDEIIIRMRLASQAQNKISLDFEYWRTESGDEKLVARGHQVIACLQREGSAIQSIPVPAELQDALGPYTQS